MAGDDVVGLNGGVVAGDDVVGLNGGVVAGEDVREDDLLVTYYERS